MYKNHPFKIVNIHNRTRKNCNGQNIHRTAVFIEPMIIDYPKISPSLTSSLKMGSLVFCSFG